MCVPTLVPSGCGTVGMKSGLSRRNWDGWTVCHTIIENNRFRMRLECTMGFILTKNLSKDAMVGLNSVKVSSAVLPLYCHWSTEYRAFPAQCCCYTLQLCNNDVGAKDQNKGMGMGMGTPACVRRVINYGLARRDCNNDVIAEDH